MLAVTAPAPSVARIVSRPVAGFYAAETAGRLRSFMEAVMDIGKFVDRRLHPVRVALGLMNHELELARSEQTVNVDKEMLRSLIETTQMFIEDFENQYRSMKEQSQKKFVTATQSTGAAKVG